MAHRLLVPPVRRLEGQIRLPMVQDIGGAATRRWYASLRVADSLRLVKTSQSNKATGPLSSPQRFVLEDIGYPNAATSMQGGLRIANAPRLVGQTRGQAAGL